MNTRRGPGATTEAGILFDDDGKETDMVGRDGIGLDAETFLCVSVCFVLFCSVLEHPIKTLCSGI